MSTAVRCPNCQNPIQAQILQLVDVGQNPAAKARLLSGTLNHLHCPVCGYEGQLATPIVYHDPAKELLLTYIPVELGIAKNEQERLVGRLINQAIDRLPAEQRKGYLLQPQAVLTSQGLVERVLQADGITREELEAQRAKLRLFEDLLRTSPDSLATFVQQHDPELDERFFQLGSLSLQTAADDRSRQAASQRLEAALSLSSFGRQLAAQEVEVRSAAESLRAAGDSLTREKLLELLVEAPNPDRVRALATLARPGIDYGFFQLLSERIEAAVPEQGARLTSLRSSLLEITEQIDRAQEARVAQTSGLLASLVNSQDLEAAVEASLPLIDDLFLSVLQANIRVARERSDSKVLERLERIDSLFTAALQEALPVSLQLAQQVIDAETETLAQELLDASATSVDGDLLDALLSAAQRLEQLGDPDRAARIARLHRHALRLSMRAKMSPPA
jgi:hypothetical protein